ncbi:MAG: hypothetical protein AAFY35_15900 [Pseudomonadota bacterium]
MSQAEPISAPNRLLSLGLIALAAGLTILAYLYHTDPGQFVILGRDTLIFLEGTSRVMQGDLPNHDFSSQLGPAMWVIPNLFLSEAQLWLTVPVLLITATALVTWLATALLRPENSAQFLALLVILAFCAMAINAPSRFGDAPDILLWHRIYSNIANTVLMLLTAWVILRLMSDRAPLSWSGATALGLALFLLFMLKVTYFLAALALLACALRPLGRDITRTVAVFVTPLLFTTVLFPAVTISYISDLAFSASISQRNPSQILADLQALAQKYALPFAALFALGFMALRADPGRARVFGLFFIACGLITVFVDYFDAGPSKSAPVLGLVIGLTYVVLARPNWPMALLPLIILPTAFAQDAYIKATALAQNHALADASDTVTYNRFRIDMQPELVRYTRSAEAAFAHLDETYSEACLERGYMVADLVNPFSALLARSGASTQNLWIHDGLTVSRERPAAFDDMTGQAAVIMVPKVPLWTSATAFVTDVYADDLASQTVTFENDGWILYSDPDCQ